MKGRYIGAYGLFLLMAMVSAVSAAWAQPSESENQSECNVLAEGHRKARETGIGSATVSPDSVGVDTRQTLTYVYTAGKAGIAAGGAIRVGVRHMNHSWSVLQDKDPEAEGYYSVTSSNGVSVTATYNLRRRDGRNMFNQYFPFRYIIQVVVGEPGLKPGDSITIVYGDRSHGSPGYLAQPFDETDFVFMTYVDVKGDKDFLPMEDSPTIEILPGKPARLSVVTRSFADKSSPSYCVVRAEDEHGNPAPDYVGTVALSSTDPDATMPEPYTFTVADKGVHRFEGIAFGTPGFHWISVTDGAFSDRSNPVKVTEEPAEDRIFWGDIHGHTIHSDGRGTVEQYYDFARDYGALDFCAVSDHAFQITDLMWEHSKKITNDRNEDGRFTTFHGYEWSGTEDNGGDHNVYWMDDDPPPYRSTNYYDPLNHQMEHSESETRLARIEDLFAALKTHLTDKNVFCIPHKGGRAGTREAHDPEVQRLVETFCEHYRSQGWSGRFLAKGYRLGLMGSSDGHYGNPGYGYLYPRRKDLVGEGLIAVFAKQQNRKSIFHAMYDRFCYADTGDRIILDVQVDGHRMGSEYTTNKKPAIEVNVAGAEKIVKVEILANNEVIQTFEPNSLTAEIKWKDAYFSPNAPRFYVVHVLQENGEEALSGPIWVN